jgi:hypothetical protein
MGTSVGLSNNTYILSCILFVSPPRSLLGTKGIETEHTPLGHGGAGKLNDVKDTEGEMPTEELARKMEKALRSRIEENKKAKEGRDSQMKMYCATLLCFWLCCNLIWVGLTQVFTASASSTIYAVILYLGAVFQQGLLLIGSLVFALIFIVRKMYYGYKGLVQFVHRSREPKAQGYGHRTEATATEHEIQISKPVNVSVVV